MGTLLHRFPVGGVGRRGRFAYTAVSARSFLPQLQEPRSKLTAAEAQLRSGRPRRRRDSNVPPPRKRTRRASRCSSSSSSSHTSFQPSPPSSSHAFNHPLGGISFGALEHPQESGHETVPPRTASTPGVSTPTCEQFTHHGLGLDTPPPTEDWQTPSYRCDSTQTMADMCPVSSFPAGPNVAYAPLFQDPAASLVPAAEDIVGGYSWCFPASSDYFLEELAQINLRIHLAGRALPSPAGSPPPWSWPAANNGFDAACSLIDAVDRFATRRQVAPYSEPSNTQINKGTVDAALDSSACLMVHACHQALLGVFEHLSTALLLYLAEQQQQTPPRTPPDAAFLPPCNTQAVIMTNLISHLLNQLDRAFLSLSSSSPPHCHSHSHPHPQQQHQHQNHKPGILRSMATPAGLPPTPETTWQAGRGGLDGNAPADILFNEMSQRQRKVRGQVKAVERLLRPVGNVA